jgi:hypothetical protein
VPVKAVLASGSGAAKVVDVVLPAASALASALVACVLSNCESIRAKIWLGPPNPDAPTLNRDMNASMGAVTPCARSTTTQTEMEGEASLTPLSGLGGGWKTKVSELLKRTNLPVGDATSAGSRIAPQGLIHIKAASFPKR